MDFSETPSSSAAASVNGLKVEPACIVSWVAALRSCLTASLPPYIATTAPSPGFIGDQADADTLRAVLRHLLLDGGDGRGLRLAVEGADDLQPAAVDVGVGQAALGDDLVADGVQQVAVGAAEAVVGLALGDLRELRGGPLGPA